MYYQSNTAAALQFPYTAMSSEELSFVLSLIP